MKPPARAKKQPQALAADPRRQGPRRAARWPVSLLLALALLQAAAARPVAAQDTEALRLATVLTVSDSTSVADPGDAGYLHGGDDTRSITGLSLRLQFTGRPLPALDYRLDYLNVKLDGLPAPTAGEPQGAARYRAQSLRWDIQSPRTAAAHPLSTQTTSWYHELDQAFLRVETGPVRTSLGRQPITWGVGRFWQPTDVFVAFAPTELERDFKPGIDALLVEAFTGDFSSLTLALVRSPGASGLDDSAVGRWRSNLGQESDVSLLAGSVQSAGLWGGSLETVFWDAGWRLEALAYRLPADAAAAEGQRAALFLIGGVDARLAAGFTLIGEWYHHSAGATQEAQLPALLAAPDALRGRRPQLSRDLLALSLSTEFGGLWTGAYAAFASVLGDAQGARQLSSLHQGALTYSLSDNAAAVFSLLLGTGRGQDAQGRIRSEFGHLPATLLLQLQVVF